MELSNDCILLIFEKISEDVNFIRLVCTLFNFLSLRIKGNYSNIFVTSISKLLLGIKLGNIKLEEKTYYGILSGGYLDVLKYINEKTGCFKNCSTTACSIAAGNGDLNCLKYLHENNCPWSVITCSNAAERGHLDCLKYAHENGCPWNTTTFAWAAQNGHLDCLKYLHENCRSPTEGRGCPWDESTTSSAAYGGHLDCLKYLRERGCPWDSSTTGWAKRKGHIHILEYARENGCPEQ
jgi:hypothetical protein